MTFLNRLLSPSLQAAATLPGWLGAMSTPTASREVVNQTTALKVSTFYACVSLVADSIAMLPKFVYERLTDDERQKASNNPLYDVVHSQPNAQQTSFEFFQMMTGHAAMRGNAYAKIVPGARGFVDQLLPLHPDNVTIEPIPRGQYRYRVQEEGGSRVYNDEDILHLRGFTLDGVRGIDLIEMGKESLGLSLASQKYSARFFGNDASPGGVLKSKGKLSPEAQKKLQASWQGMHSGERQHRTAVLEEGLEWQQVGIDPRAAQMFEREEFQAEDICRWQRVPPHMVGLTSKSTSWGSGIEQMSIGFVTYTLMRWIVAWEQAISRDLILAPKKFFVEFEPMMLLRGDALSRYNVYKIGQELGVYNPNEIRKLENMNPRTDPGGDEYVADMGRSLAKPAVPVPAPAPASAHYTALLHESAARIARKEVAALTRAAKKAGGDGEWIEAVNQFYTEHVGLVAESLCVPFETAQGYVLAQSHRLIERGPEALEDWEATSTAALIALVGGEAGDDD